MLLQGVTLAGKITTAKKLSGKINAAITFTGVMSKPIGYVDYDGSYEVTPKVSAQSLQTKDKHLTDDIKIKSIPFFNAGNETGGSTVYIGVEIE